MKNYCHDCQVGELRFWLIVALFFTSERLIIFMTLWRASFDKGGWQNFYNLAQSAPATLMFLFHERCDWHPPLYYFFASAIHYIFGGQFFIYFFQCLLAFIALVLAYKTARLFFDVKISRWAVFILAIEPYLALHNLLLANENLSLPFFLAGVYCFFAFLRFGRPSILYWSAAWLGLATLTRPNYLLLGPILAIGLLAIYAWRRYFPLTSLSRLNFRAFLVKLIVFMLVFGAVLVPWAVRNKIVYNRFTVSLMISTNYYFYNYSTLTAVKYNLPAETAHKMIIAQADDVLGPNVGDQGDCTVFSLSDLNRQMDYYKKEAQRQLWGNFPLYLKIHLIKTAPFFLQPGYLEMYATYTGDWAKPDITGAVLSGNLSAISNFVFNLNPKIIIYLSGIVFWLVCSLSLIFSLVYSFFKDRDKFLFFLIAEAMILYDALLVAAVFSARYRFPYYIFFFLSLVYMFSIIGKYLANSKGRPRRLKTFVRRISWLSRPIKIFYDSWLETKTRQRVKKFLSQKELPYTKAPPPHYTVGHEPTIRCNLRCKMCYQGETRDLRQSELPSEQIMTVYRKLLGRIKEIKLVGGEPMVRPDIMELIAFWDRHDVRVILQSNCTLINDANIEQLGNYKNLTDILTSLDGPSVVHDAVRGVPGSYAKLARALKLIREKMPGVPITVFAMALNDNLDQFYALIDAAKGMGIKTINVLFEQVYAPEEIHMTKDRFKFWGWEEGRDYRLNTQQRQPIFDPGLDIGALRKKLASIRAYGLRRDCFINFTPFNFYKHLDQYLGRKKTERVFCLKLLEPELRINQQGEVVWCDVIEKSFGNLLDKTPDEIWLSQNYQDFRKFLSRHSLSVCRRCCKAFYYK